jgi:hypothetical protein
MQFQDHYLPSTRKAAVASVGSCFLAITALATHKTAQKIKVLVLEPFEGLRIA